MPVLLETWCELKTMIGCVAESFCAHILQLDGCSKKGKQINLTTFCLFSTCSVSGWVTMTRHPLTTIHNPLWINEYVSTLQNECKWGNSVNGMKSLHCQISHKALLPRYETTFAWTALIRRTHVGYMWESVRAALTGRLLAAAGVSCSINSASHWRFGCIFCIWAK